MNIIKYLPTEYKTKCIECEKPLIKDIKTGEIYCSKCGNIYLDYTTSTSKVIDYAMQLQKKSKKLAEKKSEKKSYIPTIKHIDRIC